MMEHKSVQPGSSKNSFALFWFSKLKEEVSDISFFWIQNLNKTKKHSCKHAQIKIKIKIKIKTKKIIKQNKKTNINTTKKKEKEKTKQKKRKKQ